MVVIEDDSIEDAAQRLRDAGFIDCEWSYGAVNPNFYQDSEIK